MKRKGIKMEVRQEQTVLSKELYDRFMNVDPATMGHHIGGGFMRPEMKPLNKTVKMIGPAYTVRMEGRDAAPLHYAFTKAPRGSVIVIDRCKDHTYAPIGEVVALYAMCQGFAGIVIDGVVTDSRAIEAMDFPLFCTGVSVVTTAILGISGKVDIPISCSGAVVNPGDLVFGDADGVIVLPPNGYEEALAKAEKGIARESGIKEDYLKGKASHVNIERLYGGDVLSLINRLKEN